ncbi:MAG: bifunctional glutamate N-acetyltransferase/amino-acid acetyltransferase ArgJ [Deltaproteobacteria bacterium]|nr:bifunctional glutamate N-acetyltransferase/amino-acid acetyltransferase ArgJ [Deltaproteobacteria bacterium]MBT4015155.1 bifunctional glutamate N-acetyltransferase/amino-acid acetyltransferase ArgJ [Deltaproteobacteria bacterium]MBT4184785.1 bifunctional glutamate N-acetyltransferase/amino-acid acetyltransferase ArgJ [Deltaproteobacteria bacterium]MBT4628711.1 bifunctional glutamate N-acetyltransferase/amino-acid acetyltransferase ArgJ [Deltaproteobacteria bacterium]MBT5087615.1 bifunctional
MDYPPLRSVPGFSWMGINLGLKDQTLDFGVIASECNCTAAGVFTRNNFPGAPVTVGRENIQNGQLQAIVVNSKIANVATGIDGIEDAKNMCRWTGEALGIDPELVLPSSTGIIGRRLPVEKIHEGCKIIPEKLGSSPEYIDNFARAIMTTDTHPKWCSASIENSTLLGVAKGSGMIEPNMATMLSFFVTDAKISSEQLQTILRSVVNQSFNRISIDSDTSTSDTVVILANGLAGPVDTEIFEKTLRNSSIQLAKEIARDGEGSTKLIELTVSGAKSQEMALQISKSIINSPLVKTAIHGADPNWGRFVMAVGKVFEYPVPLSDLSINFGTGSQVLTVNAESLNADTVNLDAISELLQNQEVFLEVVVGDGKFSETVWGCDLTKDYIEENAFYTT